MKQVIVIVGLVVAIAGCDQGQAEKAGAKGATTGGAENKEQSKFANLTKQLPGKWKFGGHSVEFTSGTSVILKFGSPLLSQHVGKYEFRDGVLTLTDRDGDAASYGVEFISGGELVLRLEQMRNARHFNLLEGTWLRTSAPPELAEESGPLADAKARVAKFEKKRAALEPLLEKVLADRDDLVAKLREAGVKIVADLKGNVQGQKLAASLQRISGEIDGLERQKAALDSAVVEAKAVVRRLEREQAGIGEEEMQKLAEQLRDAEERTDGIGKQPLTPFDIEAALAKALAAPPTPKNKTKVGEVVPKSSDKTERLIGKWRQGKGGYADKTIQFTNGGSLAIRFVGEEIVKFTFDGKRLRITSGRTGSRSFDYDVEFLSDKEMLVQKRFPGEAPWFLEGRWQREKEDSP